MSEKLSGVLYDKPIALAQRTTGAAVVNGTAMNIDGVSEIKAFIYATARAAGSAKIQDFQFADDSSFTTNVSTFTSDNYLNKNDRNSATSAIDQTELSAVGKRSIALKNLALDSQKWFRPRCLVSAGSPDITFGVDVILQYLNEPKVQS